MSKSLLTRVLTPILAVLVGLAVGCVRHDRDGITEPSGVLALSYLVPVSGLTNATTAVTITGHGFQPGATVTFGGVAASVSSVVDGSISVTAPLHSAGAVDVVVTNPDGASATRTNGFTFIFIPPPSISAISPSVGSTGGDTNIAITGSGFLAGAMLTLDGVSESIYRNPAGTLIIVLNSRSHAEGAVDVVVRNPDGQSASLPGGYIYAPPGSFDFNGNWYAYQNNGNDYSFSFSVLNNALVRVSCDESSTVVTFPTPVPVNDGQVSASQSGVVIFSGRMVSAGAAVGTIKLGVCNSSNWSGWNDSQSGVAALSAGMRRKR